MFCHISYVSCVRVCVCVCMCVFSFCHEVITFNMLFRFCQDIFFIPCAASVVIKYAVSFYLDTFYVK